ncbi:dual specificity protein phosphatase 12 isoform X2 [Pseudoliparis swirei]|nr:dual specificity protein phosphatase 12 isoform X2 [Pseudoliparis swirei]
MKRYQLGFTEAYHRLKAIKPDVQVNPGFEEQLCMYEALQCELDTSSPLYKQYRLTKITEKYPELKHVPRELVAVDPALSSSSEASYRCRKCRRALFRGSSILSHPVGEGAPAFGYVKSYTHTGDVQCTSYFIEPVQWMGEALLGVMDGQSGARSLLWLGEPGAMEYTESESLELWHFVPGDTFLNRHAYFPEGERPFLKAAAEELETEVGPERSCRGSQRLAIGGRPPFDQRTAKAGAVVVRERKTWEDALEHCRERHRGLGHRDGAPPERAERRRDHGARLDRSAVLPRRLAVGGRAAAGSRGLGPGGEGRVPGGQAGSRAGRGGEPDRRRRRRMVFTGRGSMHTICRVSKVKGR